MLISIFIILFSISIWIYSRALGSVISGFFVAFVPFIVSFISFAIMFNNPVSLSHKVHYLMVLALCVFAVVLITKLKKQMERIALYFVTLAPICLFALFMTSPENGNNLLITTLVIVAVGLVGMELKAANGKDD